MQSSSFARPDAATSPATLSSVLTKGYLPLLLLLAAAYARTPLSGAIDFWAHAAIGRWIDAHGQVPNQTLYLWGAPPSRWIAHSWLSQWTFFKLLSVGDTVLGAGLTVAFTVVVVCWIYVLLWKLWARHARPGFAAPLLFALAIWCGAPRYHARPELFTALFLTVLLIYLIARRDGDTSDEIAVGIVLMFALWANLHGAVAFGLVIVAITIIGDGVQDRLNARWRWLLLLGLCCVAATLFNPYGAELWQALRAVKSTTFQSIEEWKPPYKWPALPPMFMVGEALLFVSALSGWVLNPQRRWSHLGWLLFAAASFVSARRNLWLLAIICLAVMAVTASSFDSEVWWRRWRKRTQRDATLVAAPLPESLRWIARASVLAILTCCIAQALPRRFWPPRAIAPTAPIELSRFVQREKLYGRVFNDYEYSSFWLWAFHGRPRLFIDLLNAYPDRLMNDYFAVLNRKPRGLAILSRCEIVLLRPPGKTEGLLHLQEYLDARPTEWARVYRRRDGSVWVRRNARWKRVWSRFPTPKAGAKSHRKSSSR